MRVTVRVGVEVRGGTVKQLLKNVRVRVKVRCSC